MSARDHRPRISAVLGPTNTGKTYFAIERMLGHRTGMIGFPLRLLARENYDRVARIKGASRVALVTGEEKILPPGAKYFICTVESMPLDMPVDFLAVDEVQMCADPERGHVFTDRLLRARGDQETMFLGADTIQPVLKKLVPEAEIVSRPRLSRLTYAGPRKITRLKPRSAVVAFSAADVYELAELIRRQRGGTAVVLGALSPRTRNAQIQMYQEGEVDYLVATDAIGMGLNMNVDHVAFYRLRKFDGRAPRNLTPAEIGQIAGRAGRHMSDGTFGTVAELGSLSPELVEAVETHRFDPIAALQWRNSDLEFSTVRALLNSLDARPTKPTLVRARPADDYIALSSLVNDPEIVAAARHPAAVRLLWEVCQIPDFRKTMAEVHTRFLARIYNYLSKPEGRLPTDWVADQVARLERFDGDIDTLMARIAHTRTWTYISHRTDWIDDGAHWQDRARTIEDRLSDALHDRLTQRFVDRRAASLTRMKGSDLLSASIGADGEVIVEDHFVGRLQGFRFLPDSSDTVEDRRTLMGAANKALRREIGARVDHMAAEDDGAFALSDDGRILWRGAPVAKLRAGGGVLAPQIETLPSDFLSTEQRETIRARLAVWWDAALARDMGLLIDLAKADLPGAARGIAFQLTERLGSLPRRAVQAQARELGKADKESLRRLGVRVGFESIYLPALLKPGPARLRAILWAIHRNAAPAPPPPPGRVTVARDPARDADSYEICGYRVIGDTAVRIDMLDRLSLELHKRARHGWFPLGVEFTSLTGLCQDQLLPMIRKLGYRSRAAGDGRIELAPAAGKSRAGAETNGAESKSGRARPAKKPRPPDPASPFAKLRELTSP